MKKINSFIKTNLNFILLTISMLLVLIILIISPYIMSDSDSLVFQIGEESYVAFQKYDENHKIDHYYLFLPSHADLSDVVFSGHFLSVDNLELKTSLGHGDALEGYQLNHDYECKWNQKEIILTVMQSQNLPSMYIRTDSGEYQEMWENKEHKESGDLHIIDAKGQMLNSATIKSMKCRGNYSFDHYDKKPYSLKLKESVALLGLDAGKNYCLLSNASEPTMLRNHIAREMEKEMRLPFDNVGAFLDLYLNGEYQGSYYLVEKVEISPERIAIQGLEEQMKRLLDKTNTEAVSNYEMEDYKLKAKNFDFIAEDITGGYLVEREFFDRYKLEYPSIGSGFRTNDGDCFVLHSPKECSVEQMEYLSNYFNEAEEAILSEEGICVSTGKSYKDYIDTDSFAIKYLVEEFSRNYDAGVSSNYYYKDSDLIDGKIYAGPAWDFDMSMGNYLEWMTFSDGETEGISQITHHVHATGWFEALCQKEEQAILIQKYCDDALVPYVEGLLGHGLKEYEKTLRKSQEMNYILWENDYKKNHDFVDLEQSHDELYLFIKERIKVFRKKVLATK